MPCTNVLQAQYHVTLNFLKKIVMVCTMYKQTPSNTTYRKPEQKARVTIELHIKVQSSLFNIANLNQNK